MFFKEEYDDWKILMQTHLEAYDDDMWYVITNRVMNIMKANTLVSISDIAPQMIEKPIMTIEERIKLIWTT